LTSTTDLLHTVEPCKNSLSLAIGFRNQHILLPEEGILVTKRAGDTSLLLM